MRHLIYVVFLLSACSGPKESKQADEKPAAAVARPDDAIVIADQPGPDSLKGSLRAKLVDSIGTTHITVRYHSPAVRGRIVWGGLVPFDKVWVTGAHMATSLEVDRDVAIAGQVLPAGKYAFFTIPGKDMWTLVINRNWEQHLADEYDPKLDVLRLEVKPVIREGNQERLQYTIVSEGEKKGRLVVRWEKIEIALPVAVNP